MHGKRILIGISGGIAAYKIPLLVRLLKKSGAEIKCVMTNSAKEFVTKEVLSALSENIVYDAFWDHDDGTWKYVHVMVDPKGVHHWDFDSLCSSYDYASTDMIEDYITYKEFRL